MEIAVKLEQVCKDYGSKRAVDNLDLSIPTGALYGFIGPNGSGKTTTMRMILGMYPPTQGRIEVLGSENLKKVNPRIGYLPEERGLYKKMKVREHLRYLGRLKTADTRTINERVDVWLERFGLTDRADDKVETLSKGLGQKVQFIAAIVQDPDLIILDEPFSGLDPVNNQALKDAVFELKKAGKTILFSTHDMGTAEEMCDAVLMIYRGKKVLDGTVHAVKAQHGEPVVRIDIEGGSGALEGVRDIEVLRETAQGVFLQTTRKPRDLILELFERAQVRAFDTAHSSLHDIFLKLARPEPAEMEETAHA